MTYNRIEQLLKDPEATLFDSLKRACEAYPAAAALGYFGRSFSFSELMRETECTARAFL